MNIIVPTPIQGCPAHHVLLTEGVIHGEYLCTGQTSYGELFAKTWNEGQPFICCEWDICPAPGQLEALAECPEPWCTHAYPIPGPGDPIVGFALAKVKPVGPAPKSWSKTPWERLDGAVLPILKERLSPAPHVHEPAVAHARRP